MKKIFITFGANGKRFHRAVDIICNEAKNLGVFNEIIGLNEDYLVNDLEFWNKHKDFFDKNKRGYGYWLWKPYIILKQLEKMNNNDILAYADCGCILNKNGIPRLNEYIEMVNKSDYGIISFQMKFIESHYNKSDTIKDLECENFSDTGQYMATFFILRKCEHTINLINKWYQKCCNYHLLDDSSSISENDKNFVEHRHDQSIFSLLRKKYGSIVLQDETDFAPNWKKAGKNFPVWAKRYQIHKKYE